MSFSLFPRTVLKVNSPISGLIEVKEQLGSYSLYVQGLIQSGGMVKSLWWKAIKKVRPMLTINRQSLILGLGGGNAAHLINKFWPKAKIVGIEIDPEIIKIGKKYFCLDQISNLKIVKADALSWLKSSSKRYSLILVDLYLGGQVSQKSETKEFIKKIQLKLKPQGVAIFNRLYYGQKKKETEVFIEKLGKFFPQLSFVRTASNLLIICRKRYN